MFSDYISRLFLVKKIRDCDRPSGSLMELDFNLLRKSENIACFVNRTVQFKNYQNLRKGTRFDEKMMPTRLKISCFSTRNFFFKIAGPYTFLKPYNNIPNFGIRRIN